MTPSFRVLARIAWRDVLRNRGRSLLVVALIAVPVAAVLGGATVFATMDASPEERAASELGRADVRIWSHDPSTTAADLATVLPSGSVIEPDVRRGGAVALPGAQLRVTTRVLDIEGLGAGMLEITDGRAPQGPTEIALDADTLDRAATAIGGSVELEDGRIRQVVGVVRDPESLDQRVALLSPTADLEIGPGDGWLVGLPAGASAGTWYSDLLQHATDGSIAAELEVRTRQGAAQRSTNEANAVVVLGGFAFVEAALIVSAAFAVSTRRRQRELGLLAATGGEASHLRRTVLLSGVLLGGIGAVLGSAVALAIAVALEPQMQSWAGRVVTGLRVPPTAAIAAVTMGVAAATLAAWLPARSASRLPVLLALSGRRPPSSPSHRTLTRGLAVAGLGLAAVVVAVPVTELGGVGPSLFPYLVMGGSILGVIGFGMTSPWLIEQMGRLAPRLPVGPRLAVRDTARFRTRNGPIVTAVLAGLAGAIALSVGLASLAAEERSRYAPMLGEDQIAVEGPEAALIARDVAARLDAVAASPAGYPTNPDGGPVATGVSAPGETNHLAAGVSFGIGDEALVRALGGDEAAVDALSRGQVVAFGKAFTGVTDVVPEVVDEDGMRTLDITAPVHVVTGVDNGWGVPNVIVAAEVADGWAPGTTITPSAQWVVRLDHEVSAEDVEVAAIRAAQGFDTIVRHEQGYQVPQRDRLGRGAVVVALVTGLIVLAIALTLAAAETRSDQRTLLAVGADPQLRRSIAGGRAAVLAGLGALLAIPAGLVPAWGLVRAVDHMALVIPWGTLLVVGLGLPIVATGGAILLTRPTAGWTAYRGSPA